MEEPPIQALSLDLAHRSAVTVRQDGLRTVGTVHRLPQLFHDRPDRLIPADSLELTAAFRAGSAQGVHQSVGVVHLFEISGHLVAEEPLGEFVLRVSTN